MENLLRKFGFERSGGKGSHEKWVRLPEDHIIVLATHGKEIPQYQIRQVIAALRHSGLIGDDEDEDKRPKT